MPLAGWHRITKVYILEYIFLEQRSYSAGLNVSETNFDFAVAKVFLFTINSVLPNAESTSRVQSFPQSLVPVLSAMHAGVIPCYPVAHAHSRYPNCPGGKDIIFIPGHFSFFLVTSSSYV